MRSGAVKVKKEPSAPILNDLTQEMRLEALQGPLRRMLACLPIRRLRASTTQPLKVERIGEGSLRSMKRCNPNLTKAFHTGTIDKHLPPHQVQAEGKEIIIDDILIHNVTRISNMGIMY
ncbi:serine--tRNA ligase [Sesbania bispinosa]|nr:serine--tRNA ligase [Sesbania bispinosa]